MVKKYQLANGLTVLLQCSHKSPVVSVQMWVRTGSADEAPEVAGISHFIEHLVFKGSRSFAVGEIAAVVEGSGGELNAYTSLDQTVFHVTISKAHVDTGLKTIAEMMGWPKFDADEIDREREVVIEEIKRSNDSPQRQASRLLFETAFAGHPYERPVLGYDEIIRRVSRDEIVKYYQGRYNPKNMFLVVSGDFNEQEMVQKIEAQFSDLPQHELDIVERAPVAELKGGRTAVRKTSFKENYMFLAWQIPGADDPMAPLFDVMALILGQGESSRLVHRLRIEQPLVNGIGTSAFTPQQSGLFCITATFTLEKLASIFSAITEEVVRFLVEGPQQEELDKAITNFESESYYTMETVDGLARKAGHYEFILRDPNYFSTFLERVGETKAADILALARKFLRPENMQVCILAGEGSVEELSGVSDQWRKDFTKALDRGLKLAPEMSRPEEIRSRVNWHGGVTRANHPQNENIIMPLPHGGTAIYRVSKDTASVSLRAGFLGGLRAEGHGPQGLTEMLSRTWDTATQNTSEREIKSRLDQLASSIGSFGGRNTVGLTMDTLRPFTDSMLDMFSAILLQPAFAPEIFNREREVLTTSLKNESDNPARIASYNFLEKLFGDHPYSRRMSGTIESLSQIDSEMVRRFWKSFVNATNGLIVATGDIDVESFHQRITNVFDSLGGGEQFSQSFAHESPADDVQVYSALDKEQTHIILGYKGLVLTDPQRHALHIMEAILAGQGGRLFLELRDKASLAYSVSPMRMEGVDSGYFGAYIGCSPEKSTVAIEMLKLEFKKLCDELVSDKELERAQKYLIGRHDIELQRSSAISGAIMFDFIYGIDAGEAFRFGERVMNVSKQDVQILAQSLFSQHSITSLVGPQSIW